jgi:hypothetical protein
MEAGGKRGTPKNLNVTIFSYRNEVVMMIVTDCTSLLPHRRCTRARVCEAQVPSGGCCRCMCGVYACIHTCVLCR